MGVWEIRGLFGNEFAMEQTIEELKKHKGFEWNVLDRRNLSVRFAKRNAETEGVVRRAIDIYHGWVEHQGPLGEYDAVKLKERQSKAKREEAKKKRQAKG